MSSEELPEGLRPLNIALGYVFLCTTLFINLLLAELLIMSCMDLYTHVKLNYKKFSFQMNSHQPGMPRSQCLRLNAPF